jgi:hypothetical protein
MGQYAGILPEIQEDTLGQRNGIPEWAFRLSDHAERP